MLRDTGRGYALLRLADIPDPVTRPILALISWIAHMNGYENKVNHNTPKPNWAPACEYVAIPLGSSSDAPVINPGPTLSN